MKPSDKDAFGDGHGFRMPVRSTIRPVPYKFDYNLQGLDQFARGEEFLGLFNIDGKLMVRILFRAKQRGTGLRFLTRHGSEHPHYIQDPIAWARLPTP
jgi:hypothetical protein